MEFSWLVWWFAFIGFIIHFFLFLIGFSWIKSKFDYMESHNVKFTEFSSESSILRKIGTIISDILFLLAIVVMTISSPVIILLKLLSDKSLYMAAYKFGKYGGSAEINEYIDEYVKSKTNF